MSATSNPQKKSGPSHRPAWLIALLVANLSLGLGLAAYLVYSHQEVDRIAELRTKNYALLVSTNIEQLFSNIDVALRALSAEPVTGTASEARRRQMIESIAQRHPEFRTLTLHDRNGDFVGGRLPPDGKPFSIQGRPYLEALRDSPHEETLVSGPYLGRSNNRWSIVFVRRLNAPDGSFAGVVLTGYAVERLAEAFNALELNQSDAIVVRSAAKAVIASFPASFPLKIDTVDPPPAFVGALARSPDQGFVARSGTETPDGANRLFAYNRTPTFGFYVIVSSRVDQVFADFHRQAQVLGVCVLLAWLASYFLARRSLRAETERLRMETAMAQRLEDIEALNLKLSQAQNQLLQAEKMSSIGQLAAGVAHEINNPLGFVYSNLGRLREYVDDLLAVIERGESCVEACRLPDRIEAYRETIRAVDLGFLRGDIRQLLAESIDGAERVRRIVQNLKDFSHVSEDDWQWTDLLAGLESTLNLVWNEIKYKAQVERHFGELPRVYCIAAQINQVFMNLLVNAAQAIETHGTITLSSGVVPDGKGKPERVWIEIADTGKGIAPEHLQRIFDPFFTTKPVGKGTGLGLSLSWSIVEKHHGELTVESTPGVGTRFRMVLPVSGTPAG